MSIQTLTHLGPIPIEEFFAQYWQKKPLFIKNALPDLYQLDADLLAGYSLEDGVESRLIVETPKQQNGFNSDWDVFHGPLEEEDFAELPASHWTLLVQSVNQLCPEINALLHQFRFVPNWRLDDVMVSFASDGGSVGPHFDYYDVFLLQAHGQRTWQVGQPCTSHSPLQDNCDLKILTEFDTEATYTVEPGDLLYLPPGLAHWGIAKGNSMTYSIGYRAPSISDLLYSYTEALCSPLNNDQRYSDADMGVHPNPGEIQAADITRIKTLILEQFNHSAEFDQWLGKVLTQQSRGGPSFAPTTSHHLAPDARAAFIRAGDCATLFINGRSYDASLGFAKALCAYEAIDVSRLDARDQAVWDQLQQERFVINE